MKLKKKIQDMEEWTMFIGSEILQLQKVKYYV